MPLFAGIAPTYPRCTTHFPKNEFNSSYGWQLVWKSMRKGGFEFWRRMSLPGIGSEINTSTSVRPRLHVFAPSWFQN